MSSDASFTVSDIPCTHMVRYFARIYWTDSGSLESISLDTFEREVIYRRASTLYGVAVWKVSYVLGI